MKKTKLIMTLIICCFSLSIFAFGVYAMILNVQFTVSGKIRFKVDYIAQVNNLQVIVKEEEGSVFKEYDEIPINRNGSQLADFDQSIDNIKSYIGQIIEIHIKVQTLSEKFVKIYLTHNNITNNTNYSTNGIKVRTNSVILAPQSENDEEKEFIIYVQYIDKNKTNTMQEYTLDNNFVVHFEEMNDILQEDKENGYWYVEMGTIPTTTGSEYIRWRYFTSEIEPNTDGSVKNNAKYTYQEGVRPTANKDGTGCFILETDVGLVKRKDNISLNQCNFCNEYILDPDITARASKFHKSGDLKNVLANDYATSTIRNYINGYKDVYKYSKQDNSIYIADTSMDKSNMLKDFCIDNNDYIYNNLIKTRSIEELYNNNTVTGVSNSANISSYKYSKQALPKKTDGTNAYTIDNDKFWLLSHWEAYYILGSQKDIPYVDPDDKLVWKSNRTYYLRTSCAIYSDDAYRVTGSGYMDYNFIYYYNTSARAAFKMKF